MAARAVLSLEFGWLRVFRLRDGSRTRDRSQAEQDRRQRIAEHQEDIDAAVAALLRLPVVTSQRATPDRVQLVRDLLYASVLPPVVASQVETLSAVNDLTWRLLAPLRDLIYLEEGKGYGWILSTIDRASRCLKMSEGFDPLLYDGEELPVDELAAVLVELEKEGWTVNSLHVEHYGPEWEELGLVESDDEAVKAVRCLLAKTAGLSDEIRLSGRARCQPRSSAARIAL